MNSLTNVTRMSEWQSADVREKNHFNRDERYCDERFKNRFNSLGIAVDNLTAKEAVDAIFQLVDAYKKDLEPKLVATLNVDFLVNSLGYSFAKPRHPELFKILRGADLVTADGFPIVMLSKIAGFPLKERVTGADLTPALAKKAAWKGKSVYLLGGEGDTAKQAADLLKRENPQLRIAGTSSPMVAVEGEKLATWEEDDRATVDAINASGADILFMAFGNPKQELWFSRNKHRLQVPVSIGIGGTFAFITGHVKRAPGWMQRANMEWIYRMTQDPRRLVKRYAIGLVKFGFLTLPLLAQRAQRKFAGLFRSSESSRKQEMARLDWKVHWASKDDVLKTLRLPTHVSRVYLERLVTELQLSAAHEAICHHRKGAVVRNSNTAVIHNYMIDFSKVEQMSMAANEAFCELAKMFHSGRLNGLLIGMSNKLVKRLQGARVMDVASANAVSVDEMQEQLMQNSSVLKGGAELKTYMVGETCLNYFSGDISGEFLAQNGFENCMLDAARDRSCIVDLRRVTAMDSASVAVLYRLVQADNCDEIASIKFSGMSACIEQMIRIVGLADAFQTIGDDEFYDQLFGQ